MSFDESIETDVYGYGFRPIAYTVAAGSYASNSQFGTSAAQVRSYETMQLASGSLTFTGAGSVVVSNWPAKTIASVRKEGANVDFQISITFNRAVTPPTPQGNTEEVRIRNAVVSTTEPGRYTRALPEPNPSYALPLFLDVSIMGLSPVGVNGTGNLIPFLPRAGPSVLGARMLATGDLALVTINQRTSPHGITALTASAVDSFEFYFGGTNVGPLQLTIRGSYNGA